MEKIKLEQEQKEQKMLGEYAGLTFIGVDYEDELAFVGNEKQWSDFEAVKGEEVFYDEENETYHIGVGTDRIDIGS